MTERANTEPQKADMKRVNQLKAIEDEEYTVIGVDHIPTNRSWLNIALDICWCVLEDMGMEFREITDADLDQLTRENYHAARHAIEALRYLDNFPRKGEMIPKSYKSAKTATTKRNRPAPARNSQHKKNKGDMKQWSQE